MNEDFPWSHPELSQYIVQVGSVPRHCGRADLERFLEPFGEVAWLKLYKNKPPATRHAHLIFTRVQSYFELLCQPKHEVAGCKLRVSMWKKSPLGSRFSEPLDRRKVFIKNLSDRLRIESVRKVLFKFGSVVHLDGLFDADNRQFRNIAFAVFATEAEAQRCLAHSQQIREEKGFKVRPYKGNLEASRGSGLPDEFGLGQPSINESAQGREKLQVQSTGMVPFAEYLNKRDAKEATRRREGPGETLALAYFSDLRPWSDSWDCAQRSGFPTDEDWLLQPSLDLLQALASGFLCDRAEERRVLQSRVPVSASRFEVSREEGAPETPQSPPSGLINSPADCSKSHRTQTRQVQVAFYTFPGSV